MSDILQFLATYGLPAITTVGGIIGTQYAANRKAKKQDERHKEEMAVILRKLELAEKQQASSQMTDEMKLLLDANNEFREEIRKDLAAAKKELQEANSKIDHLETLIEKKNNLIQEQTQQIISLQSEVKTLCTRIKELEGHQQ